MKKWLLRISLSIAVLAGALLASVYIYLQHPKFGELPSGDRLNRIKASPHYANGRFQNLVPTPILVGDSSLVARLLSDFRTPAERLTPDAAVPSVKTNLNELDSNKDVLVWLGHSSYFVQLGGVRVLVDPVLSLSAAPIPFVNDAFEGTSIYTVEDMPHVDYLLITHDHWDHLDHPTVSALQHKVGIAVVGLGVGAHLERWGYAPQKIREADWFSTLNFDGRIAIHVLPARHYSGRLLTRGKTLWSAYALETPSRRVFFSGDTGFSPHFADIGRRFGGFDLVALDSGQYSPRWPLIHMTPDEVVRAAEALNAKALLPGHVGKFRLARHPWDEPLERVAALSEGKSYRLVTPMIGAPVMLGDDQQHFSRWWQATR